MALANIPILLLDIQATAAATAGGTLLEVGWQYHPAPSEDTAVTTFLVRQPAINVSPRLARLTGLHPNDLQNGLPPDRLWHQIQAAAATVASARSGGDGTCPIVIHYARFERPFMERLRVDAANNLTVPLHYVCTHEIARRLLPGLPRKGLRAVAGYFGHDTPPARRCAYHLAATAVIWRGLTAQLTASHGVATMAELDTWVETVPVPQKGGRIFQVAPEAVAHLPKRPGVYRLLSRAGTPLYVGKTKDLRQRVRSYFQPRRRHAEHILEMLSRAADVKISPTRTAMEAALLEQDLIKKLEPPYNVALRSDTAELQYWSRDLTHRTSSRDRHHPWGPVPDGPFGAVVASLARLSAPSASASPALRSLKQALAGFNAAELNMACLTQGLDLFHTLHAPRPIPAQTGPALMVIARRLWLERHPAQPSQEELPDRDRQDQTPVEDPNDGASAPIWDPNQVCRCLENAICTIAALLRRGRWLTLIGNAAIAWETGNDGGPAYRHLVFRKGQVISRRSERRLAPGRTRLPAIGHRRWQIQDRVVYDRLRVATTELRRLIHAQRAVSIRLGRFTENAGKGGSTGGVLGRVQLVRLLSWI
ncbi:MAG: GIY-YIG nuclease family protein [Desulfosarcinaceae bacterium]|nr:GIY-YIG nuclease family protein [Desulfosarcinaceae bacterium]